MRSLGTHPVPYLCPRSTATAREPVLLHSARTCKLVSARACLGRPRGARGPRGRQPRGRSRRHRQRCLQAAMTPSARRARAPSLVSRAWAEPDAVPFRWCRDAGKTELDVFLRRSERVKPPECVILLLYLCACPYQRRGNSTLKKLYRIKRKPF